jgi:serine/threonine protein kinase
MCMPTTTQKDAVLMLLLGLEIGHEFLVGTLKTLRQNFGRFEESRVSRLIGQVLQATHYLHSFNIEAYDIKASNVLTDTDGTAKLADYGFTILLHLLLKKLSLEQPEEDIRAYWIAPENLSGDSISCDTRSDIWGIGALTIELFSANPPYWEETQGNIKELKRLLENKSSLPLQSTSDISNRNLI